MRLCPIVILAAASCLAGEPKIDPGPAHEGLRLRLIIDSNVDGIDHHLFNLEIINVSDKPISIPLGYLALTRPLVGTGCRDLSRRGETSESRAFPSSRTVTEDTVIKISANISKKVLIPGTEFSSQQYGAAMEIEVSDADKPDASQARILDLYGLLARDPREQARALWG